MVLDERYPLPARRTKLRSHRKRRNIVIAATIPSPLHPPRLCRDIYRRRTESFRRTTGKRPLFNRLQHAWFLVISGFSLFSPIPVPDLRWRVQSASRFPSLFFSFSFSFLFFFFSRKDIGRRDATMYYLLLVQRFVIGKEITMFPFFQSYHGKLPSGRDTHVYNNLVRI